MGRSLTRFALLSALIGLAILFGMELADDGIRTVYGPINDSTSTATVDGGTADDRRAEQRSRYYAEEPQGIAYEGDYGNAGTSGGGAGTGGAGTGGTADSARTQRDPAADAYDPYAIPRPDGEPLVDSLADKTASALQALSQGGVRAVVSLFDKLSGS
ncbi:hypothetical protein [Cohnella hashimotonis]|uniref:DUF3679 domain-containing protein n=1 Tax=Cohnella hashimotonis TaxID=2826895 RepID=A0ABT6TK56_9BACL|nr:hypothetical protein [Cohnella hashimotonis]MDI4646675.1 hypothetical protein [Cohnella hashimotonis]